MLGTIIEKFFNFYAKTLCLMHKKMTESVWKN